MYICMYLSIHLFCIFQILIQVYLDCIYKDGWLFGFYGISTSVGYLIPNSFLYE